VLGLAVLAGLFAFGAFSGGQTGTTTAGGASTTTPPAAPTPPGGVPVVGGATASETAVAVAVVANADVYESRDPFEPLLDVLEPASPSGTATSSSESSSTTSTASGETSGTLTLVAIVTEDGVRKAQLTLDGTKYTVAAGGRVGTTPWQVLEVGSDFAVMLYGDERITLYVGQGVSK
jgi:hypothetical protein